MEDSISQFNVYNNFTQVKLTTVNSDKWIPLLPGTDPDTITITDDKGNFGSFEYFHPQNLEELTKILDYGQVKVLKGRDEYNGKLINLTPGSATMIDCGVISYIYQPDTVKLNIDYDFSKPLIRIGDMGNSITVNYLTRSISWTPIGVCIVDTKSNTLSLQIKGAITNTEGDLINAYVNLISSKATANDNIYSKRSAHTEALVSQDAPQADVNNVEDYHVYQVGDLPLQYRTVTIIDSIVSDTEKFYILNVSDKTSKYGYRFISPKYIPDGEIHIYNKYDFYMGKSEIKETRSGNEVELVIGDSTMITCESRVSVDSHEIVKEDEEERDKSKVTTHHIECDIKNNSKEDELVLLRYPIGNKKIFSVSCEPYNKRKDGYIEWNIIVPSGDDTSNFQCTLETS